MMRERVSITSGTCESPLYYYYYRHLLYGETFIYTRDHPEVQSFLYTRPIMAWQSRCVAGSSRTANLKGTPLQLITSLPCLPPTPGIKIATSVTSEQFLILLFYDNSLNTNPKKLFLSGDIEENSNHSKQSKAEVRYFTQMKLYVYYRDNFEKGMNFNYDSFLFCTLLMLKCVNVVFNAKELMLCGDVELNPGPANYQKHRPSIGGFYSIAKKTKFT